MASRPLSDVPGLAAACAALACLALAWWRQHPTPEGERRLEPAEMTASGRLVVIGALLAGFAVGFRTQTLWLTAPLLLLVLADRAGRGMVGAMLGASVAFMLGALAWGIPLLVASGGLDAYLAALGTQAGEDFSGVEMLYLNPTPRLTAFALLRTFVWPWDDVALSGVVLTLAAIGGLVLAARERRTALAVAAITLPYLAFHLAFQDTVFARYALPLVVPVAFLAAVTLDAAGRVGLVGAAGIAAWSLSIGVPQLAAYVERGSPTARLFDRVASAVNAGEAPTFAMHQALQRPLEAEARPVGATLPSPPRREWLELARHWRSGAAGPVWFLADSRRTDLALVDPRARQDR
jgi:MFS family permease